MNSAPLEKSAVEPIAITPPIREPGQVDVEYRWQGNNHVQLLENGEEYFPRVFEAMRAAKSEILLETFIVFEDKVGAELQEILIDAAKRRQPRRLWLRRADHRLSHRAECGRRAFADLRSGPQTAGHPHQLVSPSAS